MEQILSAASNAASSNVQGVIGAAQAYYAMKELKRLKKMGVPQYELDAQMQADINLANERAKRGYTPEQQAAAFQGMNRQSNLAYQRGLGQTGNTLGGAVSAVANSNALAFLNQYYSNDASIMAANVRYAHGLNQEKQRIANMNKQQQINTYNEDRNAASQLLNAGMYNVTSGIQGHLGATAGAGISGGSNNVVNNERKPQITFSPPVDEEWTNDIGDLAYDANGRRNHQGANEYAKF
jgi:hypothetical protein